MPCAKILGIVHCQQWDNHQKDVDMSLPSGLESGKDWINNEVMWLQSLRPTIGHWATVKMERIPLYNDIKDEPTCTKRRWQDAS